MKPDAQFTAEVGSLALFLGYGPYLLNFLHNSLCIIGCMKREMKKNRRLANGSSHRFKPIMRVFGSF